ncbi:hypothetical protein B0H19DRAFT_697256 [Mycena capillaripes]|nr:hypothetical protein B0H19DRAFT_697256 [Mycena capillaripes]
MTTHTSTTLKRATLYLCALFFLPNALAFTQCASGVFTSFNDNPALPVAVIAGVVIGVESSLPLSDIGASGGSRERMLKCGRDKHRFADISLAHHTWLRRHIPRTSPLGNGASQSRGATSQHAKQPAYNLRIWEDVRIHWDDSVGG